MRLQYAPDVQEKASEIVRTLELNHIDSSRIIYMRSEGSKANAYARIWELPKIWQMALDVRPHYVIEVLSEKYDRMSEEDKEKTIIHELLHIPRKFSGALVPHYCFGKTRVGKRAVDELHLQYKRKKLCA
ncbi:MAG: putative metallopeptidase [archaeon]